MKDLIVRKGLALDLSALLAMPAWAHNEASQVSALSALPVMVSVALPAAALSVGAGLTVLSVTAVADGTIWVLERASDGARLSIKGVGMAASHVSMAVGTTVTVTAISAGWVLSSLGKAVCFIPNEIGKSLLYNEQVTR